ncbi:MAG TPA: hypothetical protein VEO00_04305 [Actinomycetota bacterium]|nr:hypothetical protein [Actinomycetota bacterium]
MHPIIVGLAALAGASLLSVVVGIGTGMVAAEVQGPVEGLAVLAPLIVGLGTRSTPGRVRCSAPGWPRAARRGRVARSCSSPLLHPVAVGLAYVLARGIGREDAVYGIGAAAVVLAERPSG